MACLSRLGAVLGLSLTVLVGASWTPRPLTDYESGLPAEGSPLGVRRFRHHEVHEFEDGTDLELRWEVDADPESILAVDLEHPNGVRVHECQADRLTLHVRHEHAPRAARWRHITASDSLHGCSHLQGDHLYHRVVKVEGVSNHSRLSDISVIRLVTKELSSPAHIFPHCKYYFNFVPVESKEPSSRPRRPADRRLFSLFGGNPQVQNSFSPSDNGHESLLNFDVPKQLSNIGYNWDYDANSPANPQFKYTFPGGVGFVRLYKPYLKAHFSLNINFTSQIASMDQPPHETVTAELKGYSDFNLDLATAVNFKEERSAGVLEDVLQMLDLPGFTDASGSGETFLNPIKFYLGGTPLTVKPGFSCKLKAYHIGLLKGSLRVGLASNILMQGLMTFDSSVGLLTNFSAQADHINFTAPTWMLFTQHFEMGMMLEPMFWLKGGFGDMKDMEMGFSLRPYFNVSIMQENPAALGGDTSAVAQVAIYPFRAVGLPAGGSYSVRVGYNGLFKETAVKFSTGVTEFNDNVEDFEFGTVSQTALLTQAIEVSVLQNGQPVATGQAVCSQVVNGICKPSPVTAEMQVGGQTVHVHLSVIWDQNALSNLMTKIKSVALRFPAVSISQGLSQQLSQPGALQSAELRVTRNGRTYSVPLTSKDDSTVVLKSGVIYDLGPCFLDSWKTEVGDEATQKLVTPKIELVVAGSVVGQGSMPTVQWDKSTTLKAASGLASSIRKQLRTIPVMVPLYPPNGGTELVGTGEVEVDILPAQLAAFWVRPYQEEEIPVGQPYKLYWTLVNGKEGVPTDFTLTAMEVGQDGSLAPTRWQQPVAVSCAMDPTVPLMRYDGGVPACLYSYDLVAPSDLAGRQIVIVASWLGAALKQEHWMVSTPVHFTSSRRLDVGRWEKKSLKTVNHTGYGEKVKSKLKKLASHCSAQPLHYSIGAGMNFVQHMKNVILPIGGVNKPDWTSRPIPILKPLGTGKGGGQLKDILPKFLCSGGICQGMMPGCNRTRVNPLVINKINVDLSRLFRWKQHFGPKMRHFIAYGLALAPSAIQITQNQAVRRLRAEGAAPARGAAPADSAALEAALGGHLQTERPVAAVEGRFAVEEDDGEDPELGDAEFDSFEVRITEPIDYEPTDELLRIFLQRGAFRGLSDGREATHGPVEVVALRMVRPARAGLPAREALYDATEPPTGARAAAGAAGPRSRTYQATAAGVACLALVAAALVMARAAVRRRGYTLVDPPDALGDSRLFA